MNRYNRLKIRGTVTVRPQEKVPVEWPLPKVILLLGLTGAGKSTFLEALCGDSSLKISGSSLESVTQKVGLYKLVNVGYEADTNSPYKSPHSIYILDCPGLGDTHLSEQRIIRMLQDFMVDHLSGCAIYSIFYLHRVTDKRLSRNQKKAIELIRAVVGPPGGTTWTGIITTMWDTLWKPEQIASAEERFKQLKDEYLKESFGPTVYFASRFQNTQESALKILDDIHPSWPGQSTYGPPLSGYMGIHMRTSPFSEHLYNQLMERMDVVENRICALEEELQQPETQNNQELMETLLKDKLDAENLLLTLEDDCADFGPAPGIEVPIDSRMVLVVPPSSIRGRSSMRRRLASYLRRKLRLNT